MGDRTSVSMTVYSCPPEHLAAVLALVTDNGGDFWSARHEVGAPVGPEDLVPGDEESFGLGDTWEVEEMLVGSASDIADEIDQITTDVTYEFKQGAHYAADGDHIIRTPELGRWQAPVSPDGGYAFDTDTVLNAVRQPKNHGDAVRAIERLYGVAWHEAITNATKEADSAQE